MADEATGTGNDYPLRTIVHCRNLLTAIQPVYLVLALPQAVVVDQLKIFLCDEITPASGNHDNSLSYSLAFLTSLFHFPNKPHWRQNGVSYRGIRTATLQGISPTPWAKLGPGAGA